MSIPAQIHPMPPAPARIDFGWLGQAWALFSAQGGVWIAAIFLYFFLSIAVWTLLALPTGELAALRGFYTAIVTRTRPTPAVNPYLDYAGRQATSILLAGIRAIFAGGLYRMALRQKRGELISISGLFSAFPESLPLFLIGIVVPAALGFMQGVGLWWLHFSMSPTAARLAVERVAWIAPILLHRLLMFAPLLVVDAAASAPEAILGSLRLLGRQWLRGIWFYVVASFVGGIGLLLCGVGMLATYPIFLLSITIGYLALTQPGAAAELPEFDPAPVGVWPPPPRVPEEKRL